MTGRGMREGMRRAQRRARGRKETKRERGPQGSARDPGGETFRRMAGESLETRDETARRVYRTGGKPKRRAKTARRVGERRVKWREGRQ